MAGNYATEEEAAANALAIQNLRDSGAETLAALYHEPSTSWKSGAQSGVKGGQFKKGNPGKPRGSRNKLTQLMLDRVAERQESGLSAEEILIDIMQDPRQPADLRFKAASKIADIVYPKAASVELEIDSSNLSIEEIDEKLKQLLNMAAAE